jgi:hypothetical protein
MDMAKEGTFLGLGPMLQLRMGTRWTGAISSGPGWYSNGANLDLGSRMEFRSTAYLFFKMEKKYSLGLAASHYSNGGIARHNPGAETLRFLVVVPL